MTPVTCSAGTIPTLVTIIYPHQCPVCINFVLIFSAILHHIQAIIAQSVPSTASKSDPPRNTYVHCLDGRRVTGLMVLLLRRLQNYCPDFSYSEYWRFQQPVSTPYQEELRVNREFDRFVNEINEDFVLPAEGLPRWVFRVNSHICNGVLCVQMCCVIIMLCCCTLSVTH